MNHFVSDWLCLHFAYITRAGICDPIACPHSSKWQKNNTFNFKNIKFMNYDWEFILCQSMNFSRRPVQLFITFLSIRSVRANRNTNAKKRNESTTFNRMRRKKEEKTKNVMKANNFNSDKQLKATNKVYYSNWCILVSFFVFFINEKESEVYSVVRSFISMPIKCILLSCTL